MALAADTQLGSYRIDSLIGQGGMGEVYLAHDKALDRAVAIKVLPESFASSMERVARFEREARLLATLSHQNIAGIFGLEESEGMRYLVLELVEGQTLKDALATGAMPVEETLRICRQIADALATAHDKGIIHRDLKPGNIMITPDDTVKVLDFGIAKALDPTGTVTSVVEGRTWSVDHQTAAGTMVGTPAYMSPEQARGKPIDKRSDIWSFGCLIYECLTGDTAFAGETVTDTLARILEREPDFTRVPAATPPTIQTLLRRCLQKDRKKRLHDIADARVQIDEAITDPAGSTLGLSGTYIAVEKAERRSSKLPWLCAIVCAAVAAIGWWGSLTSKRVVRPVEPLRLAWVAPDVNIDWENIDWDLSPSGQRVVFVARPIVADDEDKPPKRLYARERNTFESSPIPETENGANPKFSPSGRWIAFISFDESTGRRLLKRVALDGSPAITVRDMTDHNFDGFVWLSDDELLVAEDGPNGAKSVVSVDSGAMEPVTIDASALGEYVGFAISEVLPGGTHALGNTWRVLGTRVQVTAFMVALDDWSCSKLIDEAGAPRYAASGHLVFLRDGILMAAPFDVAAGRVTGRVMSLISGVGEFDLASSGQLVYQPVLGKADARRLMRVDPGSDALPLAPVRRPFQNQVAVSPDGRWLGMMTFDVEAMLPRIWIYEMASGLIRPITASDQVSLAPMFSNDGNQVAFIKWDASEPAIAVTPTSGAGEPRAVISFDQSVGWMLVNCWMPDDSALVITHFDNKRNNSDIIKVDVASGETTPLLASSAREVGASLSPDGRWLVYSSNETGAWSVLIRSYDVASGEIGPAAEVTTEPGASSVSWAADGRRIYYVDADDHLVAVNVTTEPDLKLSKPEAILDVDTLRAVEGNLTPLVGGGFAFIQKGEQEKDAEHFNVVLNWYDELRRKVPVGQQTVAGQ